VAYENRPPAVKHTELLKPVRAYALYRPLMIVSILKKVKNWAEDTVFLHTTYYKGLRVGLITVKTIVLALGKSYHIYQNK